MSIQDNLNTYIKNLNYKLQVESIGLNSWGDEKPRMPNKDFILPTTDQLLNNKKDLINKQLATQEQIHSYLEKEKVPVQIGNNLYKYNNVVPPTLNDPINKQTDANITKTKLNNIDDDIRNLTNDINFFKQELFQSTLELNNLESDRSYIDSYFINALSINDINSNVQYDWIKQDLIDVFNNPDDNLKIKMLSRIRQKIGKEKKFLTKKIKNLNTDIPKYESELNNKLTEKTIIDNDLQQLNSDINNIIKDNDSKIFNYENELKRLNIGSFNIDKAPTETNEEYFLRLQTNAQIPYDNSTTKKLSDIERNNLFKENMRQLFSKDSFIENILNHYRMSNDAPIFWINKYFGIFKDSFLKIYGFNNKTIENNPSEMINIIDTFCSNQSPNGSVIPRPLDKLLPKTTTPNNYTLKQLLDPSFNDQNIINILNKQYQNPQNIRDIQFKLSTLFSSDFYDNHQTLKLTRLNDGDEMFIKYFDKDFIEAHKKDNNESYDDLKQLVNPTMTKFQKIMSNNSISQKIVKAPVIFLSKTGLEDSYRISKKSSTTSNSFISFLHNFLNLTFEEIFTLFNFQKRFNLENSDVEQFLRNILQLQPTQQIYEAIPYMTNEPGSSSVNPILGMGIKKQEIPEIINFGKYNLMLKKLLTKNILSLQKKNRQKVPGFPNKVVSDAFIDIVPKIVNSKHVSIEDFENLKSGEKELLDNLLHACELNKIIKTGSGTDTLNKAKQNLNLIEGQIQAGNNNPSMKKELYNALFKLVHLNALSERQARLHYKTIINDFF